MDLMCEACKCKNDEGVDEWPLLMSKSYKGLIKVVDLGKGNTSGNQYHKDVEIKKLKAEITNLENRKSGHNILNYV
jgi:hypothetical protein